MLLWILACAKQVPPALPAPASRPSLVYEVVRDGRISHLFGTCHLPLSLEDRVDPSLIENAREVWVEARVDQVDPLAMMGLMWREAPLSEELDRELFTSLTRRTQIRAPASMADHLEPWALSAILGLGELAPDAALGEPALDQRVTMLANTNQVPIHTVETIEEQIELLRGETDGLEEVLRPTAETLATLDEAGQALLELCERNDLSQIPASLYAEEQDGAMLRDRNHRWVPRLLPSLEEGGAFVAVGALHLPGPDGLLALLAAEGFTVRNLPRPAPPGPVGVYRAPRYEPPALMNLEKRDQVAAITAQALCAEDQPARTCFLPDQAACTTRLTHDLKLCLDASFPSIEVLAQNADAPLFNACAVTGLIAEATIEGWPDREACAPIEATVDAQLQTLGEGGGG